LIRPIYFAGDEVTLQAAAAAFGVDVHVVTAHDANWQLVYRPPPRPPRESPGLRGRLLRRRPRRRRACFLTYVHPIHYNVCALESRPP
jgi:hypothetical protein